METMLGLIPIGYLFLALLVAGMLGMAALATVRALVLWNQILKSLNVWDKSHTDHWL